MSSITSTSQAATALLGMPSSLRTPSHMVPQTLANRLPGASPWKELALAGIQDANQCGRDVSTNANAIKSVLASMDLKDRAFVARAAEKVAGGPKKTPEEILKGVGATKPLGYWDPSGFSTDIAEGRVLFFREAELKHGRLCMLASLGILVAEKYHPLFPAAGDLPAYVQFQNTPLQEFWIVVAIAIAIPEAVLSIPSFSKDNPEGYYEMKLDRIPGDLGFDPLGLRRTIAKEEKDFQALQTKELNNGRLAMIATAGMIAQELATGQKIFG